jgi:hypothetical protein
MNDRQLKRLMDMMQSSAGCVITGHDIMHSPDTRDDPELRDFARECHDEGAFHLALATWKFIEEMIKRRHQTGNFQYPFEPFDEWGQNR